MSIKNLPFFENEFHEIWEYDIELFDDNIDKFLHFCRIKVPVPKKLKIILVDDHSIMAIDAICHLKLMYPEHRYTIARATLVSTTHLRDDEKTLEYISNIIRNV